MVVREQTTHLTLLTHVLVTGWSLGALSSWRVVYLCHLALQGLLAAWGGMLFDMAAAVTPDTDPIQPKQQDPMNLAEGG